LASALTEHPTAAGSIFVEQVADTAERCEAIATRDEVLPDHRKIILAAESGYATT
jgi:hypothetical protein